MFVIFPRSLKHNVLFHVLFGHELAHAALERDEAGDAISAFMSLIAQSGPLQSQHALENWLNDSSAPTEVAEFLEKYEKRFGRKFKISDDDLESWRTEFTCDIFGLLLFGPAFIAAHRVCISYREAERYQCSGSHPPFEVRHSLLQQAMEVLNWHVPILLPQKNDFTKAEIDFLDFIMKPSYPSWAQIVDRKALESGIEILQNYMLLKSDLAFQLPSIDFVEKLMKRLEKRIPPIFEEIGDDGNSYQNSHIGQILYCGWAYWLGRANLSHENIDFNDVNRLCEYAILQQEAINLF